MEEIRAELQALKSALTSTEQGWTWFWDDAAGVLCAENENTVRKVFLPHPDATDQHGHPTLLCQNDAHLIGQTLNALPKLIDALERAVTFAGELENMASMRDRAAQTARQSERYDVSELHRQSAKRVRTTKQAFLDEIADAFLNPVSKHLPSG